MTFYTLPHLNGEQVEWNSQPVDLDPERYHLGLLHAKVNRILNVNFQQWRNGDRTRTYIL